MARERVDSFSEAKELSHDHKTVRPHRPGPDIHAGQAQTHGATGQNMDGISADFQRLTELYGQLQALRDRLVAHRTAAAELTGPLTDGTSPVTAPMRKAFFQRADVDEGVQGALDQYIGELDAVRAAIVNTLQTYQGVEGDAVARFNGLPGLEGTD
ncbi:MAG TPA: hypothetical protein VGP26_09075 [Actinophytocola sp.]|jgi:hypothetical protein|nr:hypothetical protein [Actinophytocola sp.]